MPRPKEQEPHEPRIRHRAAEAYFDSGDLKRDLARRVAMPTESQNPELAPALIEYIETPFRMLVEQARASKRDAA